MTRSTTTNFAAEIDTTAIDTMAVARRSRQERARVVGELVETASQHVRRMIGYAIDSVKKFTTARPATNGRIAKHFS